MRAFLSVFLFEARFQLRSPLFILIALAYAAMMMLAVGTMPPDNQLWLINSPSEIIAMVAVFGGILLIFPAVALVGGALTRDYELQTYEQFFASGVGERAFALGRFVGSMVPVIAVGLVILLSHWIGVLMPWVEDEVLGPITFAPYAYAFAAITLPNALMLGVLCGTVGALTRSLSACYVAAIVLFAAYMIGLNVLPDDVSWPAFVDPFGGQAFAAETRYWTIAELNSEIPRGLLLTNRLIWSGVALAAAAVLIWRFRFSIGRPRFRLWRRKTRVGSVAPALDVPAAEPDYSVAGVVAQLRSQIGIELRAVAVSMPFYAILALAVLLVFTAVTVAIEQGAGTQLLPRTVIVYANISSTLVLTVSIMVIYLSAELVHRERQARVAELIDSSPFPNGIPIAAKILAIWIVAAAVFVVTMIAAAGIQLTRGFAELEFGLAATQLFGIVGVWIAVYSVLAVVVQALVPNKWAGMLIVICILLWDDVAAALEWTHYLTRLTLPPLTYSDMNGYGHYALPYAAFSAHRFAFVSIFAVAAYLFYRRGVGHSLRQRLAEARARFTLVPALSMAAGFIALLGLGSWIFVNTNIRNEWVPTNEGQARAANYEQRYKDQENLNRVSFASVALEVDLYPEERRLTSRGQATLVSSETEPLSETLIEIDADTASAVLEVPRAELVEHDETLGVYRFAFDPPLAPDESFRMSWEMEWRNEGFPNAGSNTSIVANGTFVDNNEVMPSLGYNRNRELTSRAARRSHQLPERARIPELGDAAYLDIGILGDRRADFSVRIGTAEDQIAVAPGYLQREWVENGRRYFAYEMDESIWPFFSVSSARYEVARDDWNGVAIEIYYDRKHPYNVERMIQSAKDSLEYFTREFSPYQYRQYRVLEFPRYRQFAQAFPNTIPYSESIGFIADQRDPGDVDFPYYVTSHEMAHQWWAHQVAGALMQGGAVLSETLAQYSALMVMEDNYGEALMRRFLKSELNRYLTGRRAETVEELPLVYSENQGYIHYGKGAAVMYALKDLIGEDRVNQALRSFLDTYAYAGAPFPTALDLVAELREVAGPEYQDTITDWFEKIVLYDLAVESVAAEPVGDGYEVTIGISVRKLEADGLGAEAEVPLSAWVDVGVFPAARERLGEEDLPPPLYLEKHLIESGAERIVVTVDEMPDQVGLDPYVKLIDRNPDDNLLRL